MFRFTIRDVLWLTAVTGLSVIAVSAHLENVSLRQAKEWQEMTESALERARLHVGFDEDGPQIRVDDAPGWDPPEEGTTAEATDSSAPPASSTSREITKEKAIEIVRSIIDRESKTAVVFDCEITDAGEEYRVFVTYGSGRDAMGQLIGRYPGGHALYRLSKSGEVLAIVSGA